NPYLHKFYTHFQPSTFHFQIYFLPQPFKQQNPMFQYPAPFLQHPSIYQDLHIFPKIHQQQPTITKQHFKTYSHLFNPILMTPYFP
ncbi:deoxynucleoside kinase, partial [Staphylococcus aureus]|uniref:deoxynucleoside kinase n=1 Tax=Staphylococcus aureus TaxID=1280 RepID=UPI00164282C2